MTHRPVSLSLLALLGSFALADSPAQASSASPGVESAERADRKAKKGSSAKSSSQRGSKPAASAPSSSQPPTASKPTAAGPTPSGELARPTSPSRPATTTTAPQAGNVRSLGSAPTASQRPSAPGASPATGPSPAASANPAARSNPAAASGMNEARAAAAPRASGQQARPQGEVAKVRTPDTRVAGSERAGSERAAGSERSGAARAGSDRASSSARAGHVRPHRSNDHRYARPHQRHVRQPAHVRYPPPRWAGYRPLYAHWYVHPYYRWTHATVAVAWLSFSVYAWSYDWAPPPRYGYAWVSGYWSAGIWFPGYWAPIGPPPVVVNTTYVYVPGWWVRDAYIEGYYRPTQRDDGDWIWVDGYYLEDGTYVWGHWVPSTSAPAGYVWVPGYWDGEQWLGGFWRPERRKDYVWVAPYYGEDGIFHSGYWEPTVALPGHVWIPGWFDGEQWVEGYWVSEQEYQGTDTSSWQAPDGWNSGWEEAEEAQVAPLDDGSLPLAIPIGGQSAGGSDRHAQPPGSEG